MSDMIKIWNVALYARVSTDKKEQQESIPAQVESLKKWLLEKSKNDTDAIYNLVEVYEDLGFTGTNFDRESFIRMKEDIERGKINMIVTRDLSRFARNYITAGYYLEDYFKVNGIRFISVLDSVDTLEEVNDIVPFKNILNEMYIRDCSRRSRDGLKQRMLRGSSIASRPPYGYRFSTEYKGGLKIIKLVPAGDETTEVIKKIFLLYIEYWGISRISNYLNSKGILPPSARYGDDFLESTKGWTPNTVKSILNNPKYCGVMAQGRWRKLSYKIKKVVQTSQEEWIYGDDFEGIVSRESFEKVQILMKKRSKSYRHKGETHLFSGILVCKECGGRMCFRKDYMGYKCVNSQKGHQRCTAHSIKEEFLKEKIINSLKDHALEMLDLNSIISEVANSMDDNASEREIAKLEVQMHKLDRRLKRVYEDRMEGVITQRNFESIINDLQRRQESLLMKRERIAKEMHEGSEGVSKIKVLEDMLQEVLSFKKLDRSMIEALIERIVISEDKCNKRKDIEVYLRFNNKRIKS